MMTTAFFFFIYIYSMQTETSSSRQASESGGAESSPSSLDLEEPSTSASREAAAAADTSPAEQVRLIGTTRCIICIQTTRQRTEQTLPVLTWHFYLSKTQINGFVSSTFKCRS